MVERSSKSKHGGKREGAGRPRKRFQHDSPHRKRRALSPNHPVHVVLRTDIDWLRTREIYQAMRGVLAHFLGRKDFRVCHLSIQTNHLHLLIEAASQQVLSRAMKSLVSRTSHAFNRANNRPRCKRFRYRYHSTQITTARQARNSLAYVLNNWRKHGQDWLYDHSFTAKLDPYSSAISFQGWKGHSFRVPADHDPIPVSPPTTSLLRSDWKRYGYLDCFEVPSQRFF